jgi:hypothetical protein
MATNEEKRKRRKRKTKRKALRVIVFVLIRRGWSALWAVGVVAVESWPLRPLVRHAIAMPGPIRVGPSRMGGVCACIYTERGLGSIVTGNPAAVAAWLPVVEE